MIRFLIAAALVASPAALLANKVHATHFGNGLGTEADAAPISPEGDHWSGAAHAPTGRADAAWHAARADAATMAAAQP